MRRMLTIAAVLPVLSMCPAQLSAQENTLPEEIRKELGFLVGTWNVETDVNGTAGTAKYTAHWTAGNDSLILTFDGADVSATAVGGWDPTSKEIVETWYSPTLGRLTQRFKAASPDVWEGTFREQQPDGEVIEGKIRLEKTSQDSFTYSRTADGTTIMNVNQRVKPEPQPTNADRLKPFEYFIGKWKSKGDDGDIVDWEFSWGHKKNSIENKIVSKGPDGEITIWNSGILIWDAGSRRFVNVCVNADGHRLDFLWEKKEEKKWQTWLRGNDASADVTIIDQSKWDIKWDGKSHIYERQD
jgi:hypothetical protein